MCGDEPIKRRLYDELVEVCPTCVGMNRGIPVNIGGVERVCPTCVGMNRYGWSTTKGTKVSS